MSTLFWLIVHVHALYYRHSKIVTEQTTREKILSNQPRVPIATVSANRTASAIVKLKPVTPPQNENSSSSTASSTSSGETSNTPSPGSAPKPRRVLPEHEGRYKITLPMGTTKRSKEILAKKAICMLIVKY